MTKDESKLRLEAERATEILRGKSVAIVWRHRSGEVGIEFTDGSRLFVDHTSEGVELSITEGAEDGSLQTDI